MPKPIYALISTVFSSLLLALVAFYRRFVSPALHAVTGSRCRYQPTCSEYAARSIQMHGPFRGLWLALGRIGRCHPFHSGGPYDDPPVRELP